LQQVQRYAVQGGPLLQNNAHPHSVAAAIETIGQLKFERLPHPPYILDLAPSDCHMFGPLKAGLHG
jgi:hypothetical protein